MLRLSSTNEADDIVSSDIESSGTVEVRRLDNDVKEVVHRGGLDEHQATCEASAPLFSQPSRPDGPSLSFGPEPLIREKCKHMGNDECLQSDDGSGIPKRDQDSNNACSAQQTDDNTPRAPGAEFTDPASFCEAQDSQSPETWDPKEDPVTTPSTTVIQTNDSARQKFGHVPRKSDAGRDLKKALDLWAQMKIPRKNFRPSILHNVNHIDVDGNRHFGATLAIREDVQHPLVDVSQQIAAATPKSESSAREISEIPSPISLSKNEISIKRKTKPPKHWLRTSTASSGGSSLATVSDSIFCLTKQARQTAFNLSMALTVTTSLTSTLRRMPDGPSGRVRIHYHVEFNIDIAGDDSEETYAFPIVMSNGLRYDETIRFDRGEAAAALRHEYLDASMPARSEPECTASLPETTKDQMVDSNGHEAIVTLLRYAQDLKEPVKVLFDITYPLRGAENGETLLVTIPTFRPRVGAVKTESVFVAIPHPPLIAKASLRRSEDRSQWTKIDGLPENIVTFKRQSRFRDIRNSPARAKEGTLPSDDIRIRFYRWRSVKFDDGLHGFLDHNLDMMKASEALIMSVTAAKVAWNSSIEIGRLLSGNTCIRLSFCLPVTNNDTLLILDPEGWLASHFTIDGRCTSPTSSVLSCGTEAINSTWTSPCFVNDDGFYVILRPSALSVGKIIQVQLCWYESSLVMDCLPQGGPDRSYKSRIPRIMSHHLLGVKIEAEQGTPEFLSQISPYNLQTFTGIWTGLLNSETATW